MSAERQLRRIRKNYDRNAERYERCMGLTDRLTIAARRKVGEAVRGRVLEVGVGSGLSLPFYGSAVTSLVGVDVSREMLRLAARRAAELPAGPPVWLLQMDAQRLGFAPGSFDSVAFNLCLCTIPDPRQALRAALEVARPGAPFVFLEHVRSHLWPVGMLQDLVNPLTVRFETDHFNRRTAATIWAAGVEVLSVERWALGFFNLIVGQAPL